MKRKAIDTKQNPKDVLKDPGVCRIPVRINDKVVIYIKDGDNIEEKRRAWENRLKTSGVILKY